MRESTRRSRWPIAIAIAVLLLFAAYLVVQRVDSGPKKAEAATAKASLTTKQRNALISASLVRVGCALSNSTCRSKVRKILRPAFGGEGWWTRVPVNGTRKKSRGLIAQASSYQGCDTAYVEAYRETPIVNLDLMKSSYNFRYCWKAGKVTKIGTIFTHQKVTGWGQALNWHKDGVRRGARGWGTYGGKFHGSFYDNEIAKFTACAGALTGCFLPTSKKLGMSLSVRGNGEQFSSVW
jgi:hypothetical protein